MPFYDEIEIEDFTYDKEKQMYYYPCPCGDKFSISLEDLWDGEDDAPCNSCTLYVTVIYDESDLPPLDDEEEDSDDDDGQSEKADGGAAKNEGDEDGEDKEITDAVKNLSVKETATAH